METQQPTLALLFEQLGLPNSDDAIERFIAETKSPEADMPLPQWPIWSATQSAFLQEAVEQDAEWAEVVDQLDARLRH